MKPIKDLVSIVTPVYNAEKSLQATIDSVKAQSEKRWELILVNDCSTDGSADLIAKAVASDKRITAITLPVNSGAARARNVALDAARGQYIAFLDSDDAWDSTKLDRQLDFMRQNAYAFTYTAYRTNKGRIVTAPQTVTYDGLLINNVIGCLTVMVDRTITGDFKMPEFRKGQDHLTWLSLLKAGIPAYGLNEVLATYTEGNTSSLSGNKLKAAKRQWFNYRKALGFGIFKSTYHFIRYAFANLRKYGLPK